MPSHEELSSALNDVVAPGQPGVNGGLGNHMWAVLVDRGGYVCAVTHSGDSLDVQWPGSRAVAAAKAFTANGLSLPNFALSTANLYWPVQPGSSLYGLEVANPADAVALYAGDVSSWGSADDPLTGQIAGGTIAFGGGLALYSPQGDVVGGIGLSGDEACTDHVIAWKMRHNLNLDNVPDGVADNGTDNIVYDLTTDPASGRQKSASGYGHPECSGRARTISDKFAEMAPVGPEE